MSKRAESLKPQESENETKSSINSNSKPSKAGMEFDDLSNEKSHPEVIDLTSEVSVHSFVGRKHQRTNRESCSICRDGGDLLLCDNCPRSFHVDCLKLKESDIPEGEWFCPTCLTSKNNRQSKEYDEKKQRKNEKRREWRLKKKALKAQSDLRNKTTVVFSPKGHVTITLCHEKLGNGKGIALENLAVIPEALIFKAKRCLSLMDNNELQKEGYGKLLRMIDNMRLKTGNSITNKELLINRTDDCVPEDQLKDLVSTTLVSIYKAENSVQALNDLAKRNSILYSAVNNEYWNSMSFQMNSKHLPKYPIEDSELYANPILHSLNSHFLIKPIGVEIPFIPKPMLNQLMLIWDFCQTFAHKIKLPVFSMHDLYFALNYSSPCTIPLLIAIHSSFIFILLTEVADKDYQSLQSEGELMLLKLVFESLATDDRKIEFIHSCWIEILILLLDGALFLPYKTQAVTEVSGVMKQMNASTYSALLTPDQKLGLLLFLLSSSYDTQYIREVIKVEQEKQNDLRKLKRDHEEELRFREARKRELERQEKYTMPLEKIKQLTLQLQTLSEDNQTLTRQQLARLRKEKENEREKYKSVIKESEQITQKCDDISEKIDKIQAEIGEIPSMNKKCIGIDGLGNKYFFFPWETDKLYIRSNKEWRLLVTNESIKELMTKLSDKGIHERSLLVKLNRIYPKKLKCQDTTVSPAYNEDYYLKSILRWSYRGIESKEQSFFEEEQFNGISTELNALEGKITDYFNSDNKEWESFDVRCNIKSWLECNRDMREFAKVLLLWNERCKNPYKSKQSLVKSIIEDEYDAHFNLITDEGKLEITKVNPSLELALKTRLWSKEQESLALEEIYLEYLTSVESRSSMRLAIYCFNAVFDDLMRRRDFYRRRAVDEEMLLDVNHKETPSAPRGKVVIINDDDGEEEEYQQPAQGNRRSNLVEDEDDSEEEEKSKHSDYSIEEEPRHYKSRLRKGKLKADLSASNDSNGKYKTRKQTIKLIEWNETCMHCDEFGDLICCEDCPNVTHLACANLNREPEKWRCSQCIYRLANRRMTRSQLN